jgi:HSP20 family protein
MSFIKIKFGNNFEEEFQRAVDEVFHLISPAFKCYECIWRPHVDIYESTEEIIVMADLAGLNKEELHIELNHRQIKIAGIRRMISVVKNARYFLAEIPHGNFVRNIVLPAAVDAESAVATYAEGILIIRINKLPENKTHRIIIKTAE